MAEAKNARPAKSSKWDEMKTVRLDKSLGGDRKSIYVAVNGKPYLVPTGKVEEVPLPVYEVLERMQIQMDVLDGVRDDIKETSGKQLGKE